MFQSLYPALRRRKNSRRSPISSTSRPDTIKDESATEELIKSEIPRLVEDALLCDGRILKVYDFEFEFNEDYCNVHFKADTIYGTTEVEEVI